MSSLANPLGLKGQGTDVLRSARFVEILGAAVLLSRILTTGPAYFCDGPAHLLAAFSGRFIIQPPGYWLFNRLAGLFADPELAIDILNWAFSLAGVVVFYYLATLLVKPVLARLGAVAYAAVYYVWFSGNVQSTYASQLLFPVLVFLFIVLHQKQPRFHYLLGATVSFAIGAGLRPSDGAFLAPLLVYYLWRYARRREMAACLLVAGGLCGAWLAPTFLAYRHAGGFRHFCQYIEASGRPTSVLMSGMTLRTLANAVRFIAPLLAAFWALAWPMARRALKVRQVMVQLLLWWVVPGAAFLVLFLMNQAPYLNFLTAALILLALLELNEIRSQWGAVLLLTCIVSNVLVYALLEPIRSHRLDVNVFNACVVRYTHYAVEHRWQPDLSELSDRRDPFRNR